MQSISLLCIAYGVIKGQFLSYHAYIVWEVEDLGLVKVQAQAFSFSSYTLYHHHEITEILLLWHETNKPGLSHNREVLFDASSDC